MRFPTSTRLSPRQKMLLAYLGKAYGKNRIDGENVIYRDLGDYDIEISGCHTKNQPVSIYVWEKKSGFISWRPIPVFRRTMSRSNDCSMRL